MVSGIPTKGLTPARLNGMENQELAIMNDPTSVVVDIVTKRQKGIIGKIRGRSKPVWVGSFEANWEWLSIYTYINKKTAYRSYGSKEEMKADIPNWLAKLRKQGLRLSAENVDV